MTSQSPIVWRIAAAVLWIASIACLSRAIGGAVTAEESGYNPNLTAGDRLAIRQQAQIADRWGTVGWILQIAAAAVLSIGLTSKRMARRIFVSLGVLIGADGILLLLMAVIVR